jgi:ubiquitin carboxyl-terminal hydrolase 5/13
MGLLSDRYASPLGEEEVKKRLEEGGSADDVTTSIEPRMFKVLVGRGHTEFSSNRQQDAQVMMIMMVVVMMVVIVMVVMMVMMVAQEYLQHLLGLMEKAEPKGFKAVTGDASYTTEALFRYEMEDRFQCVESGQVKYLGRVDNMLSLQIPLERAVNSAEVRIVLRRYWCTAFVCSTKSFGLHD